MRRARIAFFCLALLLGGMTVNAYAVDCTKDTLIDQFGDWFGNLGKPEVKKKINIASRKAGRFFDCNEKQKQAAVKAI